MEVRDAVEGDAGRLADLTDTPRDVMRNLVHDRTVRVAESDEEIVGFVSFDARAETVHVTQLDGDPETFATLLAEPIAFAQAEDMAVELLATVDEPALGDAAIEVGFSEIGSGPSFGGEPTTKYRLEPGEEAT